MSADQIFILVLVTGILLLIARLSWSTHQRAKLEEQQLAERAAAAPPEPAQAAAATGRAGRRRPRQAR